MRVMHWTYDAKEQRYQLLSGEAILLSFTEEEFEYFKTIMRQWEEESEYFKTIMRQWV